MLSWSWTAGFDLWVFVFGVAFAEVEQAGINNGGPALAEATLSHPTGFGFDFMELPLI